MIVLSLKAWHGGSVSTFVLPLHCFPLLTKNLQKRKSILFPTNESRCQIKTGKSFWLQGVGSCRTVEKNRFVDHHCVDQLKKRRLFCRSVWNGSVFSLPVKETTPNQGFRLESFKLRFWKGNSFCFLISAKGIVFAWEV